MADNKHIADRFDEIDWHKLRIAAGIGFLALVALGMAL